MSIQFSALAKLYRLRVFVLVLSLLFATNASSLNVVLADGEDPHPAVTDDVPQIDLSDTELLINLTISAEPTGELTLETHHFREDVLSSPIAVPWFWAARIITFDNRCSRLSPLEDPTIARFEDPEDSHEHAHEHWGSTTTATKLRVELPVEPGMHEIEILNSDYEVVAKYNAAALLDTYCAGDPDNPLCKLRKSLLILLDDDDGMEDFSVAISDSFEDLEHLEKVSNREGYKLLSADETPLYLVDIAKTSFPWEQAHTATNPFEHSSGKGVYNGYKGLRSGDIDQSEGSLMILLEEPARGVGMKLGFMTPSQVMKQDDYAYDMSSVLSDYEEDVPIETLQKVSTELIGKNDPVLAAFAVYDSDGKKINSAKKSIVPIPGLHTFVGLVTPNNNISYVEINYSAFKNPEQASAEFVTDIMLFAKDAEKLAPRPAEINEKPCESPILFHTGSITDFNPLPELDRLVLPEPDDHTPGRESDPTPTPVAKDPVVPTPTPTITPPRPDLPGPGRGSGSGSNPLSGSRGSEEPVIETRPDRNDRDEEPQEVAVSCNSSFGSGGSSSSEGIVIGFGLILIFGYLKGLKWRRRPRMESKDYIGSRST